jgi:hypothetical protein
MDSWRWASHAFIPPSSWSCPWLYITLSSSSSSYYILLQSFFVTCCLRVSYRLISSYSMLFKIKISTEESRFILIIHSWITIYLQAHLPNNSSFNFQRYIQRSLDSDFKEIVGIRYVEGSIIIQEAIDIYMVIYIVMRAPLWLHASVFLCHNLLFLLLFHSPWMWFVVVIFMLVDVHGKLMLASASLLISLILKKKTIISKLINLYVTKNRLACLSWGIIYPIASTLLLL